MERPAFDELPLRPQHPPLSAWGLYGENDQLGTLNLLTPETVREAAKEIQTGVSIGLNSRLDLLSPAPHNRLGLTHTVIHKAPRAVHDDLIHMNTQVSTQWDGLRHYGYQQQKVYYNGATAETFTRDDTRFQLGTQAWCERGILGRAVLLDYLEWSSQQGKHYDLLGDHAITVPELEAVKKAQNVEFKPGDILIIRSGFHAGYCRLSPEEKLKWSQMQPMKHVGVHSSREMARWFWENSFSACAGDAPAFERMPADSQGMDGLLLHEVMLSGWGMPIGEMWDLEQLSSQCMRTGRYSFMLSSMPLNIPGGVGSPANATAIF